MAIVRNVVHNFRRFARTPPGAVSAIEKMQVRCEPRLLPT
jgi:hypothetical protein